MVSVGRDNQYGHPKQEVMARLDTVTGEPENVLTTMQRGDVDMVSDGQKLVVRTQR